VKKVKKFERVEVINVGLEFLYDELVKQGIGAVNVNWAPPAQGNQEMLNILRSLRSGKGGTNGD